MARTNLPVTQLVANGGVLNPSATAIDQANGMNIALNAIRDAIPAGSGSDELVLIVSNTAASAKNVTLRAGASNPPAFRKDKGDLAFSVTNGQTAYVGPFEWARFCQPDGSLNVDFDAGTTGTILPILLPRSV